MDETGSREEKREQNALAPDSQLILIENMEEDRQDAGRDAAGRGGKTSCERESTNEMKKKQLGAAMGLRHRIDCVFSEFELSKQMRSG